MPVATITGFKLYCRRGILGTPHISTITVTDRWKSITLEAKWVGDHIDNIFLRINYIAKYQDKDEFNAGD